MNWIVVSVLGLIFVVIPTTLAIGLCVFRDTHEYDAHYNENGYTQIAQEQQEETRPSVDKEPFILGEDLVDHPPVSEWPREL